MDQAGQEWFKFYDERYNKRRLVRKSDRWTKSPCAARNRQIVRLRYESGWTLRRIADHFGLSVERVRQIARKHEWGLARFLWVRAHLARPIELDDPSARDVWHCYEVRTR